MGLQVQASITGVTSGTPVAITAKTFARYVEIAEDGSGAAAGLVVKWPNGNTSTYTPGMQPIKIGTIDGSGPLVGVPANYNGMGGSATQYCTVESVAATTVVRVSEWN
jgi:hypothetical protein